MRYEADRKISKCRMMVLSAVLLACAFCPIALCKSPDVKKLFEASIKARFEKPTFVPYARPLICDRGRLLAIGQGVYGEQNKFFFLDLASGEQKTVEAPLQGYFQAHLTDFPKPADNGFPAIHSERLLFYDPQSGQAGILISSQTGGGRCQLYLHWNLAEDRIESHSALGCPGKEIAYIDVQAIHFSPERNELFLQYAEAPAANKEQQRVWVLALSKGNKRTVASLQTQRRLTFLPFFDDHKSRVLIAEYAELPIEQDPPRGYLIELETGKQTAVPIPVTCYGAAFSQDGASLFAYSNQLGELWQIDLSSNTKKRTLKIGARGHALGSPLPNALLLIRADGMQWVDPSKWALSGYFPMTKLYEGFSHIEGSLVAPGWAVVKNGDMIYVVRVQ